MSRGQWHVAPPHGTRARYVSRRFGCRCPECRAGNAREIQAWRLTGSTKGVYQPPLPKEYLTGWPPQG